MTKPYFNHLRSDAIFLMNSILNDKKESYYLIFTALGELILVIENDSEIFNNFYFLEHIEIDSMYIEKSRLKSLIQASEIAKKIFDFKMSNPLFQYYYVFILNDNKKYYYLIFSPTGEIISIVGHGVIPRERRAYFLNDIEKHPAYYEKLESKSLIEAAEIAKKYIILK